MLRNGLRSMGWLSGFLTLVATIACGGGGGESGGDGTIIGKLGGLPSLDAKVGALNQALLSERRQAVSSVEGLTIHLVNEQGEQVASAQSDESGGFEFSGVAAGSYTLAIDQDPFSEVAYSVDTERIEVDGSSTVGVGLPVVKRVMLPSYPQPTTGSPVTLDEDTGRVYMAIDQGLLVFHPVNDTLDLLYASDGFRSDYGPRLLTFIEQENKLLIITPSKIWIIDETIFSDDDASEVINYDDPATRAALGTLVDSFEVRPSEFIDTSRRHQDGQNPQQYFDPHYYRFDTTTDGLRLYVAAGDQAAVIDWSEKTVARVFTSSGRMAHYASASNRLFFLQDPNKVLIIDADELLQVASYDLSADNPTELLGVSSRPSTGDGYVAYNRLSVNNDEVLFLLIVDPNGLQIAQGRASELLGAGEAAMEPGIPHWQPDGTRLIVGDSLFEYDANQDAFQPISTGSVRNSSLSANGIHSNLFRSADVPNSILISYFGEEDNAAVGFFFLDKSNPSLGIRVVRGRVPIVTLDENHGRGIVFGDGAMSIIYYNASDAASAQAEVFLGDVGASLLGGAAGTPCNSTTPCPDGGVCVPVDEFNTDEGTCTPQAFNPFKMFCGGIGEVDCDAGYECHRTNPTNPQSAGDCVNISCAENPCPDNFYCQSMNGETQCPDGDPECWGCDPQDPECRPPDGSGDAVCICLDMSLCGPACSVDDDCPAGYLCSEAGHCALNRCLSDESCPDGKVCGVTDQGRACVTPGSGLVGEVCISSSECASAYCRGGVCVQSCSKTSDCLDGEECIADEWAGYCGAPVCGGCAPDQICRWDHCDLGDMCAQDLDCGIGSVCADGRCRTACEITADCATEQVCLQPPPHISTMYCAGIDEGGGRCRISDSQPGCPPDMWCSEWGACLSGSPCYEWEPNACPAGEACIGGACQSTCTATAECDEGQECTGGNLGGYITPEGGVTLTCQPASCHCPQESDICVTWDLSQVGQCWNWTDCTQSGVCPEHYTCDRSNFGETYYCRCDDDEYCASRCLADDDCPQYHRCDLDSGQCVMDSCTADGDCDDGRVCGYMDGVGRVCLLPGTRDEGAPCDYAGQCSTGACIWNLNLGTQGGICVGLCNTTADCAPGEVCGFDGLPMHVIDQSQGQVRICWSGSVTCAHDEFEVGNDYQNDCTDGTRCFWDGSPNNGCPWPTTCAGMGNVQACACSDAVCDRTCGADAECNDARLACKDGLCRLAPSCGSDLDCQSPKVCGFVDGYASLGPRCVAPGSTPAGDACDAHSDCASGVCAANVCAQTCAVSSDCGGDQECLVSALGLTGFAVGTCGAVQCACQPGELCLPESGLCHAGPVCNGDAECQAGQACIQHVCWPTCVDTGDCAAGSDCTGMAADLPHICYPAGCGCAADQVCEGGVCITSRPCDPNNADGFCAASGGGRCISGQCYTSCTATSDCAAGLECVAVQHYEWDAWQKVRVCTTPTCDCQNPAEWCYPGGGTSQDVWVGCYVQHACNPCPDGYTCSWVNELENAQEQCYHMCTGDDECPEGTVCGAQWQQRVCVVPGDGLVGDSCGSPSDCASGACMDPGQCIEPCSTTGDCAEGQVCGQAFLPSHVLNSGILTCFVPDDGLDCLDAEIELNGACTDRTVCDPYDGDEECTWPTQCRDIEGVYRYCMCDNAVCDIACQTADACGDARLGCFEGLCRPLPPCNATADCENGAVCGFVDGHEDLGPRCVAPGTGAAGEHCDTHADCASGFCAATTCANTCGTRSDCQAGEECVAVEVSGGIVLGACATASYGCAADEAYSPDHVCGPGPLCNTDADCDVGAVCHEYFCRTSCVRTDECAANEDCVATSADRPNVCLPDPAGCGCAADEICLGGRCVVSRPCQDSTYCDAGDACIGGQCYDGCAATSECASGLECVAVRKSDNLPDRVRVCTTPVCDCVNDQDWCSTDPLACWRGSDCQTACTTGYSCLIAWDSGMIENMTSSQACRCQDLASCGPHCEANADCPGGYTCDNDTSLCTITECLTDGDCPDGLVCGFHPTLGTSGRACWLPGPQEEGELCSSNAECVTAACLWSQDTGQNICVSLCSSTAECGVDEVCTYDIMGAPGSVALCKPQADTQCPAGCPADSWCHNNTCYTGVPCFWDYNRCPDSQLCDNYTVCRQTCTATLDCPEDQECILSDPYTNDPLNSTAVCRDPECNCMFDTDVCKSNAMYDGDQRDCIRLQTCGLQGGVCPTGYSCAMEFAPTTCLCTDEAVCGPTCQVHADCPSSQVCDPFTSTCIQIHCAEDVDCPAESECGFHDGQRYCYGAGSKADGQGCQSWTECHSGMCYQSICVNPCTSNDACAGGLECQSWPVPGSWQVFPFCFNWAGLSMSCGCSTTQFCDNAGACQEGPSCTQDVDCGGFWCESPLWLCHYPD